MGVQESGMWTPHSLAPGLLQNVLVLVDLNLVFSSFTALK